MLPNEKGWGADVDVFLAHELHDFEGTGVGAVPALMAALYDTDWQVRRCAARLLDVFGPDAGAAVPALVRALADGQHEVRKAAWKALLSIEALPLAALRHVVRVLRQHPGSQEAILAARAVSLLERPAVEEALPLLVKGLRHSSVFYRSAAAQALGKIGVVRADIVEALKKYYLVDTENACALARALAQLAPELLSTLLPTLDGLPLIRSLFALTYLGEEAGPLFPAVFDLYQHYVKRSASGLLVRGDYANGYSLSEALLMALARMGHYAGEAIAVLLEQHRRAAANVLLATALRMLLIATFLEGQRQQSEPARESAQVVERLQRRGALRKQRELLAWLGRRAVEEADVLRNRVELGDLAGARLELVAALGYEAAQIALGQKRPRQQDWLTRAAFSAWAEGLSRYGTEACVRVGHALGRSVLHFWSCEYPDDVLPPEAVLAVENWIASPNQTRQQLAKEVKEAGMFGVRWPWTTGTSAAAAQVTISTADVVGGSAAISGLLSSGVGAWMNISSVLHDHVRPGVPLSRQRALAQVRRIVREMVVPWALGRYDPVREGLAAFGTPRPESRV
jgi:HEAT repeat protein